MKFTWGFLTSRRKISKNLFAFPSKYLKKTSRSFFFLLIATSFSSSIFSFAIKRAIAEVLENVEHSIWSDTTEGEFLLPQKALHSTLWKTRETTRPTNSSKGKLFSTAPMQQQQPPPPYYQQPYAPGPSGPPPNGYAPQPYGNQPYMHPPPHQPIIISNNMMQAQQTVAQPQYITIRRSTNHGLCCLICLLTGGVSIPCWIYACITDESWTKWKPSLLFCVIRKKKPK